MVITREPLILFASGLAALAALSCAADTRDFEGSAGAPSDAAPGDSSTGDARVDADSASKHDGGEGADGCDGCCVHVTCLSLGAACGTVSDQCGGVLDCGDCADGQECGTSAPNQCGSTEGGASDAVDPADATSCTNGDKDCVGLQVLVCDAAGNWQPGATCSTACVNGACEDACLLPWGGTIAHGQSTAAYQNASETSPSLCSNNAETRTCNNGALSGSYQHSMCTQKYRDCPLSGYGVLLHGTQVSSYEKSLVPCGATCSQTTITCNDGTLSGGSGYIASCSVDTCDCDFAIGTGFVTLGPGQSCSSHLVTINTTSGCTGGVQYYATYDCTYTCNANGTVTRSSGGPCEMGDGSCGGSVVTNASTTTCPDGW